MGLQDAAGSNSLHTPPRSPSELFGAGLTPKVVGLETGASGPERSRRVLKTASGLFSVCLGTRVRGGSMRLADRMSK